jgi:hypothetical protein
MAIPLHALVTTRIDTHCWLESIPGRGSLIEGHDGLRREHPQLLDMEVIVRRQDQEALRLDHLHIKHYVGERAWQLEVMNADPPPGRGLLRVQASCT